MIAVRDLVHQYGEGDGREAEAGPALDGVTLEIPDGEFLILAGPNGAGKSTLVRHFNGLCEPDSGTLTVNGRAVAEHPVAARTAVGMVFQTPRDCFVAATIGADVAFGPENLGLSHDEIDRRVQSALDAVRMTGREDERIDRLSGGEQARVAVAGALAMEPDHLVLDEPFAGLDAAARETLVERLAALKDAGTGVIAVTHDLRDAIDLADRVVVLQDGQIVVDAPPADATDTLAEHGVRVPC
jgi:biotin transport system ATP-binding protein